MYIVEWVLINSQVPHINVMSKLDLLNKKAKKDLERFLEPDMLTLLYEEMEECQFGKRFKKLNQTIANVVGHVFIILGC